jgi:tRNA threonylcarbamoyladenosine modification (KEOPS) complex Cgi121 subunit
MLKHLAEEARYVAITGFRGAIVEKPDELLKTIRGGKQANVSVQFFIADVIATWEHLYFAVLDALMAFRTKRNISNSLAVEVMLYASAQRQIKKAIDLVGVTAGCADIAVVVVGESQAVVESALAAISRHFGTEPNEHVLDLTPAKTQNIRKVFAISENELAVVTKQGNAERALVDLVIERMALLSTRL